MSKILFGQRYGVGEAFDEYLRALSIIQKEETTHGILIMPFIR